MDTGIKEVIVRSLEEDSDNLIRAEGFDLTAFYRADVVYDVVDHEEFMVVRFGEPTTTQGDFAVIPYDLLFYCKSGNTDKGKRVSTAARKTIESIPNTRTQTGIYSHSQFVSIGADQYDVGYKSLVLVTHMIVVGSGY